MSYGLAACFFGSQTLSSNLAVEADTWYVFMYRSQAGVPGGKLTVDVQLSGSLLQRAVLRWAAATVLGSDRSARQLDRSALADLAEELHRMPGRAAAPHQLPRGMPFGVELLGFLVTAGPTVLVAADDYSAQALYGKLCQSVGAEIPGTVSVLSVGNTVPALSLPVTAVDPGADRLGFAVLQFLLGGSGSGGTRRGFLEARPTVVDRGSVARPVGE